MQERRHVETRIITLTCIQILCTQPRKIAAVSLAERVAFEYAGGSATHAFVGGHVGYKVGSMTRASKKTKILYITEGSLLTMLLADQDRSMLSEAGAVIIDEAHERNISTDILLGMLKKYCQNNANFKVIVTSATLDTTLFSNYFDGCPVLEIPGRTFPVDIKYQPVSSNFEDESAIIDATMKQALQLHISTSVSSGDILCFLTGQDEVNITQTY